jgi:hypothetical protein
VAHIIGTGGATYPIQGHIDLPLSLHKMFVTTEDRQYKIEDQFDLE